MAISQIDLERQSKDATLVRAKLVADFLNGANLNLTDGNNDATLTGLANGVDNADAVNKGQLDSAIAAALTNYMNYKGGIDASVLTGETLDGAAVGDFYYVTVSGNLDGLEFTVGDHLLVSADITDFSVDGSGKIQKVDNTEAADILRDGDIINDLVTGGTDKVLSAQQGVVLKGFIDDLQTELDDTQTGAGLNADGTYVTPSGSNYIDASTSLANADSLLDAQIKLNADDIAELQREIWGEAPTVTNGSGVLSALANIPVQAGTVRVYLNGMRQQVGAGNDYTINETTGVITFNDTLKNVGGNVDVVLVDYKY